MCFTDVLECIPFLGVCCYYIVAELLILCHAFVETGAVLVTLVHICLWVGGGCFALLIFCVNRRNVTPSLLCTFVCVTNYLILYKQNYLHFFVFPIWLIIDCEQHKCDYFLRPFSFFESSQLFVFARHKSDWVSYHSSNFFNFKAFRFFQSEMNEQQRVKQPQEHTHWGETSNGNRKHMNLNKEIIVFVPL